MIQGQPLNCRCLGLKIAPAQLLTLVKTVNNAVWATPGNRVQMINMASKFCLVMLLALNILVGILHLF